MMLFHQFDSRKEREDLFGGDCAELARCRFPRGTGEEIILRDFEFWAEDSLYIDSMDENDFRDSYDEIFTGGKSCGFSTGHVDWCGFCWFSPEETARIMEQVRKEKPADWETLLSWLENGKEYNGFYFLGI